VRLVVASGNPGKLREIGAILAPLSIDVVAQSTLGIPEAEEPHATFLENALAKARHASRAAQLPALADDSGLCVDALGGAPGVDSAYYAGREGEPRATRCAQQCKASFEPEERAGAHYRCVMVFVRQPDDPSRCREGVWRGEIARAARGSNGFGYDPLFYLRNLAKTAAELDPDQKNRISHRGIALQKLLGLLRESGLR
jgi:XTP/dITP diphosphohydrolase